MENSQQATAEQLFEELVRQVPAAELPQVLADLRQLASKTHQ